MGIYLNEFLFKSLIMDNSQFNKLAYKKCIKSQHYSTYDIFIDLLFFASKSKLFIKYRWYLKSLNYNNRNDGWVNFGYIGSLNNYKNEVLFRLLDDIVSNYKYYIQVEYSKMII